MTDIYNPAGVDITATSSTAQFKLGQRAYGSDDQEYVYVLSSGAITQYSALCIDEDFTARQCTTTLAALANAFGASQITVATDKYFWAATKGHNLSVRLADNIAADAQLYTTATAGVLSSESSTGNPYLVNGLRSVAAAPSGGGAAEVLANYPSFNPRPATF